MTRADDLRSELVTVVNDYLLDNVDPGLAETEDEALVEAGDLVDLVLQAAYERTIKDMAEIAEAFRRAQFAARRSDGTPIADPPPTQQTWWEAWPAVAWKHLQARKETRTVDVLEVYRSIPGDQDPWPEEDEDPYVEDPYDTSKQRARADAENDE